MLQKVILIADDEEELIENLRFDLRKTVKNIVCAGNGEEALLKYKKGEIDCILTDINMPQRDGITFIKEVRELGFKGPVIFLTAHGDDQLMKKALSLNAFDFINKPYTPDDLIKTLSEACEQSSDHSEESQVSKEIHFHKNFKTFLKEKK